MVKALTSLLLVLLSFISVIICNSHCCSWEPGISQCTENMVCGKAFIRAGNSAGQHQPRVCSQVDCGIPQKGCPCFLPDNLINHVSVAMNLNYQSKGRNHWNYYFGNSGLIVVTDPSCGSCIYA